LSRLPYIVAYRIKEQAIEFTQSTTAHRTVLEAAGKEQIPRFARNDNPAAMSSNRQRRRRFGGGGIGRRRGEPTEFAGVDDGAGRREKTVLGAPFDLDAPNME